MEKKGLISRLRQRDEHAALILLAVPAQIGPCIKLKPERAQQLYTLLYELLENVEESTP